jgi:L-amino acid N-acyltransferase
MAPPPALPRVRAANDADGEAMRAIYNDAVATTVATFDTEPRSREEQLRWLREHRPPYVALVAESEGEVVGWASLSRWSERRAYAGTAEVSLYVAAPRRGAGIGRLLLARLLEEGERAGFHTLLARVADGNAISLHLHTALGFRSVGVMKEVGMKFGRRIDVHLLQRIFADPRDRHRGGREPPSPSGSGGFSRRSNRRSSG